MKIYVVGGNTEYAKWINKHSLVGSLEEADIVLFTGGDDVSPELYGERNLRSYNNKKRDLEEVYEYLRAKEHDKFCLGICRGSQFLTVMSGGRLFQDVTGHAVYDGHKIDFNLNGKTHIVKATSTHHQMMNVEEADEESYEIIAKSSSNLSNYYISDLGYKELINIEPEIVFYPKKGNLCVQPHPEYMDLESKFVILLNELLCKKVQEYYD